MNKSRSGGKIMKISEVTIQNYRSISKLKMKIDNKSNLITVCGANNVGKTNFLRALDLFFSLDKDKFDANLDIPYHIAEGSRGSGYKTTIIVKFDTEDYAYVVKTIYTRNEKEGNILRLEGKKNKDNLSEKEIKQFIEKFRFVFVESSNVDFSKKISDLVTTEVLLSLDKLRTKQSRPLEILNKFTEESKKAVSGIEDEIGKTVSTFVDGVEGIDPKTWKIKILFPEFSLLREAISELIDFTLYDTNDRKIDTKGSGIQKILLYSIIDYISEEAKKKNKVIIWGLDEPEAFLQTALQKKVFRKFKEYSKTKQIFSATHSQFFINLDDTNNVFLFESTREVKEYKRKKEGIYYKVNTLINTKVGSEKVEAIRNNFGISKNDAWHIVPYNLLVEGEDDKQYLTALFKKFEIEIPNIFVANGIDKVPGYLQFLDDFCLDLEFKPKILCILDHDRAGMDKLPQLKHKKNRYKFDFDVIYIHRCDGVKESTYEYEIEDFMYPDLIRVATNKLLKIKGYKQIKKSDLSKRFSLSYTKENILKVFAEITKHNNPDKNALNIDGIEIKKYISYTCVGAINRMDDETFKSLSAEYPTIKYFIEKIAKSW